MSDLLLKSLDITNFRSIRGQVHAPLDAKVVLVHGENGAGKTSLLSAIELALTGRVQSLERADQGYEKQLLHRSAQTGSVLVKTLLGETEQSFKAVLNASGVESLSALDEAKATFFRERAFLPQSLLGQLLQIYQDAGNDAASPLAQFVGKLLGLDRLDALEAGLKPLADVRNVRKTVDGWQTAENERSRIDRLLSDQRKSQKLEQEQIASALTDLATITTELGLSVEVREDNLEAIEGALKDESDTGAFAALSDQQRRLAALRREIETAQSAAGSADPAQRSDDRDSGDAYAAWQNAHEGRVAALRSRVEALFPDLSLESAPEQAAGTALSRLRTEQKQLTDRVTQARGDISRHTVAQDERDVALRQRDTIDAEGSRHNTRATRRCAQ
jgi:exonuclease SbcC